ncbi:bacillithiol biosynthesis cysteine-adding enzyme BshC [Lacibacter luteus]|uniref:Putative cysteine ligase BshC n=1 Tax=Lacibacter luteus TaxID=2508719 RepID=A0A4Q1CFD1_9BACT|nr:bacillithiol biosynthesis cysteine-adding enzyme BshC [Lacibacter luteus]RXK58595.1 bacillithiol biosynthesis cysteine-adding enzyme BshC [Lacibacter luteus]
MDCTSQRISYRNTAAFSTIVLDYLDDAAALKPFYVHRPNIEGIKQAIAQRSAFNTNRTVLVDHLKKQYAAVSESAAVNRNIDLLLQENTFTIITAHQPNLFTGSLYFIYKILHAIKLADSLKQELTQHNFVPVYYMGSEDADFEELSYATVNGVKYQWATQQNGAFGKMVIDKNITQLIHAISGQLLVEPHGKEIVDALLTAYKEKTTIQDATFSFVHFLFERFGLIVIIADAKELKQQMIPVFEDELLNRSSSKHVAATIESLEKNYKVQAGGREINLFYFDEDLRERIEADGDGFAVANTTIKFSKEEMLKELKEHPERFSPNVILRGLYQDTILPNIAFIGGGGELAYWLELKEVFTHYKVPYPVLIVRNSFLVTEQQWIDKVEKLGFTVEEFFKNSEALLNDYVHRTTVNKIQLNGSLTKAEELYELLKTQASAVDPTLLQHVESLKVNAIYRLQELEKKIIRAEKRKYADEQRQIQTVKQQLFPGNGLQERKESFLSFYAKKGKSFIDALYQHSLSLEQEFVVLSL